MVTVAEVVGGVSAYNISVGKDCFGSVSVRWGRVVLPIFRQKAL